MIGNGRRGKPGSPEDCQAIQPGRTVGEVCHRDLAAQDSKLQAGELSPRTFAEQKARSMRVIDPFGRHRAVEELTPRAILAATYGPNRLATEIVRVRTVFNWAFENQVLSSIVRCGTAFSKPKRETIRRHRNQQPKREMTLVELRQVVKTARSNRLLCQASIAGMPRLILSILPRSAIDVDGGCVEHERAKTAVMRRCPLWPETVKAVRQAIAERPDPIHPDDEQLAFRPGPSSHPRVR